MTVSNISQHQTMADSRKLAYTGSTGRVLDRDSDAWYTPSTYVEAAREVMGGIDLDPFSSAKANESIKAGRFFNSQQSAFNSLWRRPGLDRSLRVWMNPPYSSGVIGRAVDTFLAQLAAGNIEQGIVLTNNATDTSWFGRLKGSCNAVCFTNHRISFESPDGKRISGNTRGQTFFYFGSEHTAAAFKERFSEFGWSINKQRGW